MALVRIDAPPLTDALSQTLQDMQRVSRNSRIQHSAGARDIATDLRYSE
jgi:hypothetical protein